MADIKEFAVDLIVTTEHRYLVPARTPEEAVSVAEDLFEGGDEGEIIATSVDNADAVSGEDYVEAEDFEEE